MTEAQVQAADSPSADPPGSAEDLVTGPRREARPVARRRPARGLLLGAAGLAVVTVAGVGAVVAARGDASDGAQTVLPPATTEVTRGTLVDRTSEGGTLGFGTPRAVTARTEGTLTAVPSAGDRIRRGETLFRVDDQDVPLLYGSVPAWRDLTEGVEGRDVRQLERNLAALGYDGFTVDGDYTDATADAVQEWQEDLGLDETGVLTPADIVFHDGPVRVDSVDATLGTVLMPGASILTVTGTEVAVSVELETDQRRLAPVGGEVEVELPDGSAVTATITETATEVAASESGPSSEEATTTLVVVAQLSEEGAHAAQEYDAGAVNVTFTAGERPDVLMVPVAALLALSEGGFGLEVVANGQSSYVPVDTGLFSGGLVEVSGDGITEGTVVGVPAE